MNNTKATLRTFDFAGLELRVIMHMAEPWFVAADACDALGMDRAADTGRWLRGLGQDEKREANRKELPQLFCGSRAWALSAANTNLAEATAAKSAAKTAQTGSEAARDASNAYRASAANERNLAETARTGAEAALATVNTRKAEVEQLKTDVTNIKAQAVTDVTAIKTATDTLRAQAQTAKTGAETARTGSEAARDVTLGYRDTTLKGLSVVAKQHDVKHVIVEGNFGDGMFTQLLKPVMNRIHQVTIEEVKHSIQKERRICDTLEPIMNQHRLVIAQEVVEKDRKETEADPHRGLMYQMSRITRDKGALAHDDRLDVLAMAVAYWSEAMARDTDKAHEEHQEQLRDQEFEAFIESALRTAGREREEASWLDL